MAQQLINIGATPNDGTGDQLRNSFDKSNQNFTENYASIASIASGTSTVVRATAPVLPHGVAGDLAGMIAFAPGFLYVCILDYVDDTTVSWQRVAIASTDATNW